jgi:methionyl-tRNA formyltransferase
VYDQAASVAADLLEQVVADPSFRPQPDAGMTYAEKLTAADRELDPVARPEESLRRIRALSPHIGARTELNGRRVTIWDARVENGRLVPEVVQPEGRRRMAYDEFLRGLRP